jgi:hypothetical protein
MSGAITFSSVRAPVPVNVPDSRSRVRAYCGSRTGTGTGTRTKEYSQPFVSHWTTMLAHDVDRSGNDYVRLMCDPALYLILDDIAEHRRELPKLTRRVASE